MLYEILLPLFPGSCLGTGILWEGLWVEVPFFGGNFPECSLLSALPLPDSVTLKTFIDWFVSSFLNRNKMFFISRA